VYQKVCVTTVGLRWITTFSPVRLSLSHFLRWRRETLGHGFMLCLTLRISSSYRSLIYPCITISIGGHRQLTQSTHKSVGRHNRSQTKRPYAILSLQNFDTLMCLTPLMTNTALVLFSWLVLLLRTSGDWNETFFIRRLNGVFSHQVSFTVLLKGRWSLMG